MRPGVFSLTTQGGLRKISTKTEEETRMSQTIEIGKNLTTALIGAVIGAVAIVMIATGNNELGILAAVAGAVGVGGLYARQQDDKL